MTTPSRSSVAATFLASRFARGVRPELAVHPDDEMLGFARAGRAGERDAALAEYLWNGRWIADTVLGLVEARFGSARRCERMLDFACGYGRLTRWLAAELGPGRVVVSDILAPAVDFQRERFGVEGFVSTARPEELPCAERFDLVWVGSLFTHLPEPAFRGWLARLAALVGERGLLAFTTLDMSLSPEGRDVGGAGHRFAPISESRVLDTDAYGTAWVTAHYVARTVAALPGSWQHRRLARGVCDYQDLILVAPDASESLDRLPLDPGPIGFVERAEVVEGRRLVVSGWAWDGGVERPVAAVEVALAGGPPARTETLGVRVGSDLAGIAATGAATDWRLEAELDDDVAPAALPVWVAATGASGSEKLFFLGTLGELLRLGVGRERDAWRGRAELAEARAELFAASGFGRLHRAWLRAKRALGRLPADFPADLLEAPRRRR